MGRYNECPAQLSTLMTETQTVQRLVAEDLLNDRLACSSDEVQLVVDMICGHTLEQPYSLIGYLLSAICSALLERPMY